MNKLNEELKAKSKEQLYEKINDLRKEYFGLRLNIATAHVKDYSQFKKLRRSIASALTYLKFKDSNN